MLGPLFVGKWQRPVMDGWSGICRFGRPLVPRDGAWVACFLVRRMFPIGWVLVVSFRVRSGFAVVAWAALLAG